VLNAKEKAMARLTIDLLLVSAVFVILGIVAAIWTFLLNRREEGAPFRNYFSTEYDRDLRQQSSWCDEKDWPTDQLSRFAPIRLRDLAANEERMRVVGSTERDGESS
jgi:hypothetical protein